MASHILFSHNFTKIKVNSYDSLTIQRRLTFHSAIIHIKPVLIKDENHYCCKIFLETCSYQLARK